MVSRVLIVEDEPFIGMHLADIAEAMGFEVAGPALSSQSALMVAHDRPPDIAIVDANLRDGPTGPFIASQLAATFGTQVLVVTANPELVVEGLGGVAVVLTKPYDPSEVAEVLAMLAAASEAAEPRVRH